MKHVLPRQEIRSINQAMKKGGHKIDIDEKRKGKYMHSSARIKANVPKVMMKKGRRGS